MEDNDLARNLGSNTEIRARDEGRYKAIIPYLQMGQTNYKNRNQRQRVD
jgi:hypothetical protein